MRISTLSWSLCLVGAPGLAWAQSSVSIFGVIDTNLAHFSSSGAGSVTALGTDGNQSSRLGFRGTESLGGDLKAGFWLEAAFTSSDGTGSASSANNQPLPKDGPSVVKGTQGLTFNRRSTVSLSGNWGELRLGRDYVPGFWNLSKFSPFGTNGVGCSSFLFYPVTKDSKITSVRASNSMGYHLPSDLGGVYGQVMVAMGGNSSASGATQNDGNVLGARLGWAGGPVDVALGTTQTKLASIGDISMVNLGLSVKAGPAKLMALTNQNKTNTYQTNAQLLGATLPVGAGEWRFTYAWLNASDAAKTSGLANDANQIAVGYVHNLSKRTALYAQTAQIRNKDQGKVFNLGLGVASAGGTSSGYELGLRHNF